MNDSAAPVLARIERVRKPLGALLALLLVAWAWTVVAAPIDATQGVIQKILYVHPPLAYGAYLGFVLTAFGGALYLWKHRPIYDHLAVAGAEVGVVFCTLMMVTGPIWAKGTWGHWWSWDPRLTLTLLLWFVYLAYLLLRSFTEGSERTARFAAIYGVAGTALIPLNYFVIDLARGPLRPPGEPRARQPRRGHGSAVPRGEPGCLRGVRVVRGAALGGGGARARRPRSAANELRDRRVRHHGRDARRVCVVLIRERRRLARAAVSRSLSVAERCSSGPSGSEPSTSVKP